MVRALPYIVPIALALYALIDLSRSQVVERAGIRPLAWVAMIVLLPVVGPVAWIAVSRSRRVGGTSRPASPGRPSMPGGPVRPTRRPGPVAPDDDPDFLWRLDQQHLRQTDGHPTDRAGERPQEPAGARPQDEAGDGPKGPDRPAPPAEDDSPAPDPAS